MTEPTITCPSCKVEIKLTESLAAPLIDATRREYERRLAQKDSDVAKREAALHEREEAVSKAKEGIEQQVGERLNQERAKIAAEEARKAKLAPEQRSEQKAQTIAELQADRRTTQCQARGSPERSGRGNEEAAGAG